MNEYLWRTVFLLLLFQSLYHETRNGCPTATVATTTTTGQTTEQSENANVFRYSAYEAIIGIYRWCGSFSLRSLFTTHNSRCGWQTRVRTRDSQSTGMPVLLLRYFMQIIVLVVAICRHLFLTACLICMCDRVYLHPGCTTIMRRKKNVNRLSLCVAYDDPMFYKILLSMHHFPNRNQLAPSFCIVLCAWASDAVAVCRTI